MNFIRRRILRMYSSIAVEKYEGNPWGNMLAQWRLMKTAGTKTSSQFNSVRLGGLHSLISSFLRFLSAAIESVSAVVGASVVATVASVQAVVRTTIVSVASISTISSVEAALFQFGRFFVNGVATILSKAEGDHSQNQQRLKIESRFRFTNQPILAFKGTYHCETSHVLSRWESSYLKRRMKLGAGSIEWATLYIPLSIRKSAIDSGSKWKALQGLREAQDSLCLTFFAQLIKVLAEDKYQMTVTVIYGFRQGLDWAVPWWMICN